jgi:hypothetical protein
MGDFPRMCSVLLLNVSIPNTKLSPSHRRSNGSLIEVARACAEVIFGQYIIWFASGRVWFAKGVESELQCSALFVFRPTNWPSWASRPEISTRGVVVGLDHGKLCGCTINRLLSKK